MLCIASQVVLTDLLLVGNRANVSLQERLGFMAFVPDGFVLVSKAFAHGLALGGLEQKLEAVSCTAFRALLSVCLLLTQGIFTADGRSLSLAFRHATATVLVRQRIDLGHRGVLGRFVERLGLLLLVDEALLQRVQTVLEAIHPQTLPFLA